MSHEYRLLSSLVEALDGKFLRILLNRQVDFNLAPEIERTVERRTMKRKYVYIICQKQPLFARLRKEDEVKKRRGGGRAKIIYRITRAR